MFKNSKIIPSLLIFIYLFFIPFTALAESTEYVWSSINSEVIETSATPINPEENFLGLTSGSAILIEQNSGKILYQHNIHEQLRPASVTKVMTLLLIMEAVDSRRNFFNRYCSMF